MAHSSKTRRSALLRELFTGLTDSQLLELLRARLPPEDEDEDEGCCLVHRAAADGDLGLLTACLAADSSLAKLKGPGGRQPLSCAARMYQAGAVEALLTAGAPVGALDSEQQTAAHHLCSGGFSRLSLTEHIASDAILARLVAAGADLDLRDAKGRSPLDLAVGGGFCVMARLLLKHGAVAATGDAGRDASLLCSLICSAARQPAECLTLLRLLLERGVGVGGRDAAHEGRTPLLAAAEAAGQLSDKHASVLLQMLLKSGADAAATDDKGRNCLHYLAKAIARRYGPQPAGFRAALEEGSSPGVGASPPVLECVRALLQAGADPQRQRRSGHFSNESLAQWLVLQSLEDQEARAKCLAVLKLLLDAGMDINSFDSSGRSTVLTILLRYVGTNGFEMNYEGKEPLGEDFWAVLEALLARGADPRVFKQKQARSWERVSDLPLGYCPLEYALSHNSERLIRRLVAAGADASVGDGYGLPLLEKLWHNLVDCVSTVIEGASEDPPEE